ncbi:hypothetical protein SK128_028614 [Halocaridina rubra]|uniref:Centriolar and ciliogenesis-associated protein HYLS1 C-terminal domain-containing protein n=1 Tax=Halocaridina rubra TaxID=373956 RepID=A0AAN8ZYV6_HALRR
MPYHLRITENEVRAELEQMGFTNVPDDMVESFRKDLLKMIKSDLKKLKKDREKGQSREDSSFLSNGPQPVRRSDIFPETSTPLLVGPTTSVSKKLPGAWHSEGESGYSDKESVPSHSSYDAEEEESDLTSDNVKKPPNANVCERDTHSTALSKQATKVVEVKERDKLATNGTVQKPSSSKEKDKTSTLKRRIFKPKKTLPSYPSRNDPVSLYHYYRAHWDKHKVPGEDPRSKLRWEVRTKLFYSS